MLNYDNTPVGDVTLTAPASGTTTFQFPATAGAANRPLITDGAGVMSWNDQAVTTDSLVRFGSVTAIAAATQDAVKLAPRAGGTGSYISSITTTTLTGDRTITLPDATGTVVLGGGTCSGASSGTNTGDQTTVSGNAGTATALQNARTIGGSSFNGTANVTSFPAPGAIGGTTPDAGTFTSVRVNATAIQDAIQLSPRAGGTSSFLLQLTTATLTNSRTITFPDSTGTVVLGGGTCSGASSGTNTGDQTTVSGNAGTATTLQTARNLYGNSFDGSADLNQVIASTYGGTGNGFTKFSGPTTSEKTKTLRNATDTILELGGSYTPTGTWTSLTLVTPALGTPVSGSLPNCTGLPIGSGVSGLGTGIATALAVNVGTAGAPVINGGALGTPSSGTVNNLTGTASININGTVGATTPAAGTFTTLTINGNTTIGDAAADTITQKAQYRTLPTGENITKTSEVGVAEAIMAWKVSDDATSSLTIANGSSDAGVFAPKIQGVNATTNVALNFNAQGTTDTGTNPVLLFMSQIGGGAVATRPVAAWWNLLTSVMELSPGNNLLLKGGASVTLASLATDTIALAAVDSAANDRQLYARTEAGQANRLTGLSCRNTSGFAKTSDTSLANITGLTRNVLAGEVYAFRAVLFTTSNVAGGIKFAIAGTATATSFVARAVVDDTSALKVVGTARTTTLGATLGDITAVTVANVVIEGTIVVNAGGTLTVQFAQNASNGSASTVLTNSTFQLISVGS